jgi:hypothetical protein
MSYEIIESIKVKNNKVFINCAPNNVYPRSFGEFHCESLTKILKEQGKEALELEIMREYENGNFQGGNNKYARALKVLHHMPEYKKYNWRNRENDDNLRDLPAFVELLKTTLKTRLPKDKFIITKQNWNGHPVYFYKLTKRRGTWTYDKSKAKIFRYHIDAVGVKGLFAGSDTWTIEQIQKEVKKRGYIKNGKRNMARRRRGLYY